MVSRIEEQDALTKSLLDERAQRHEELIQKIREFQELAKTILEQDKQVKVA